MIEQEENKGRSGRIVGRILPAAIGLWLRSQAEKIEDLSIEIVGRDRDLLSGRVPSVSLTAEQSVYRGIYLNALSLSAKDIRINVGQVVRGKPLRLLKAFPVVGSVLLREDDLNASLDSDLLSEGLNDFWRSLVQLPSVRAAVQARYGALSLSRDVRLDAVQAKLTGDRIGLCFYPSTQVDRLEKPVVFESGLKVVEGNLLQLVLPQWIESLSDVGSSDGIPIEALQGFQWNLGSDVEIDQLAIENEQIVFNGKIWVNP